MSQMKTAQSHHADELLAILDTHATCLQGMLWTGICATPSMFKILAAPSENAVSTAVWLQACHSL